MNKAHRKNYRLIRIIVILCVIAAAAFFVSRYGGEHQIHESSPASQAGTETVSSPLSLGRSGTVIDLGTDDIPPYDIYENMYSPYAVINDNVPYFDDSEWDPGYEYYPELDDLGRCGSCEALIGEETMPTGKRGDIHEIHPSGWKTYHYDFMGDDYLYNRCHLIGFKLAGENANPNNLITGTRYFNTEAMLPFEDETAYYVYRTGNHVKLRVTPLFAGDDLVARGVLMEARSVEDNGKGVCFCVFCYNVQPGVIIDYATGYTEEDPDYPIEEYYK